MIATGAGNCPSMIWPVWLLQIPKFSLIIIIKFHEVSPPLRPFTTKLINSPPTLHWPDPFERIASLCERLGTLLEAACAAASPIPLACWGKERSQLSSLGGGQKQPKWLMEFIQMWDWSLVFSSMANILMEHSWNIEKNDGHRIEFVVTHLCKCMKLRSLGWNLIPGWNPKEWESEKKNAFR